MVIGMQADLVALPLHALEEQFVALHILPDDKKGGAYPPLGQTVQLTDGNGISKNVRASYTKNADSAKATNVTINGKPLDPNKIYRVATIDYLAKGGDYMTGLTRGKTVAQSKLPVYDELLRYLTEGKGKGRQMGGDTNPRWTAEK